MTGLAVKEKFNDVVARVNSSDGIIVAIGIGALIFGILIDVFAVRLLCLLIVAGAGILVYAIFHSRQDEVVSNQERAEAEHYSESQKDEMKKLIFDDFQSDGGGKYTIHEVPGIVPEHHHHPAGMELVPGPGQPLPGMRVLSRLKPEPQPVVREFQVS